MVAAKPGPPVISVTAPGVPHLARHTATRMIVSAPGVATSTGATRSGAPATPASRPT
jgi:hypothetical protein